MKRISIIVAAVALVTGAGLYVAGYLPVLAGAAKRADKAPVPSEATLAPAVTVARVAPAEFHETVLVTGSLVPREEILVSPEVDGLRVLDVLADEGDRVKKGQTLARLVHVTLDAQLAQNDASLARATAAIAQAQSTITQSQARLEEAGNSFNRAKPLKQSGYLSESVFDQREAAARTAEAQLVAARDGLKVAEAERAQVEAQRSELMWRRARTDVMAPADGILSRRNARVGALASAVAEPMFRIIANGQIELDAEVPETRISSITQGQQVRVEVAGRSNVAGTVRLVSPEVDKATRLGRVRIALGDDPALRIGSFGRGVIDTDQSRGLAVPASAVLYGAEGAHVQVVAKNRVESRKIDPGLTAGGLIEARTGLVIGELVIAKSGTFLRDGDAVRPILSGLSLSGVK